MKSNCGNESCTSESEAYVQQLWDNHAVLKTVQQTVYYTKTKVSEFYIWIDYSTVLNNLSSQIVNNNSQVKILKS